MTKVLALILALAALGTGAAPAQIVSAGVGGQIELRSGFPPFNAPFGFVTTGVQNIPLGPGGGLFLQRWHASLLGSAEGETGIRVLTGPLSYFFNVPASSALFQRRLACLPGDPPAELLTRFNAVFRLGPNGLPAHLSTLAYPVVGQNAPGPGSYSMFWARLTVGYRDGVGGAITPLGAAVISYSDHRPGAAFSATPTAARLIPQLQNPFGNRQLLVWGDVLFRTRGCPLLLAPANGLIGGQDGGALPPQDPGILDLPIEDPESLVLDLPLPLLAEDGIGTLLQEIVEDASHVLNQRPRIQPIPEQRVVEGETLSFAVDAEDPDGDSLSYGVETTEAGMTIDPNGIMTWTAPPGSAGVHQATVTATDDRGELSQTDEEVVTIIVEPPH